METQKLQETSVLNVNVRSDAGKGTARKLRRQGRIPGVFYGSRCEPLALELNPDDLVTALNTPKLKNTLIRLISESSELNDRMAMVKEIQRHPLSRDLLHVDLMEVYSDVLVRANVPIHLHGHAGGVELGGTLEQHLRSIHIRCTADIIPAFVDVDVTPLQIGGHIKLREIPFGDGIEVLDDISISVASVVSPRVLEETKEEGEAAEGAEAAAGDAKAGAAKAGAKAGDAKAGDAKAGDAKAGDAKKSDKPAKGK